MSLAASRRSAAAGALPLRAAAALCQHCNSNSNSNGSNSEMNISCYCCRESSEIMCVNSRRASVSTPAATATATTTTTPSTIKQSAVANKKMPSQASSTSNKIQARQQKFLAAAAALSRVSHPKLAPSSAPPAQCDRPQPQKVATSVRQQHQQQQQQRTSAAALSTPTVSSLAPSSQQQQPQVAASAHESRSQLGASSQRQQQQPPTATIDRQFQQQQQQQAGSAKFIYNNNICQQTATTTTTTTSQGQCHNQSTIALNPNSSSTTLTSSSLVQPTTTTTTSTANQHRQRSGQPSAAASSNNNQQQQQQQQNHNQNLANQTQHHQPSQQHQFQQNHQPRQHFAMSHQHQHHHQQQQQHSHNITHYKYHNDCQSSVLTYEQVKRLDFVMDQIVPIHGRGNFPTLYIKLKELIRMVKYKLQTEHSIEIRDVRLNGGAASYVLAPENSHYNDLDLVFGTDLSDETSFDVMRDIVLECLRDIFQKTTTHNFLKQQQHQLLLQPSPISNIGSSLSASNNIQNHNIADNYNHHIQFNQQQQHHYQVTTQTNNVDQQSRTTGPLIENNRQRTVVCNEGKNNDPYGQEQKVDNIKNTKNININNNDNYNTEMMIDTATKVESDKNQLNNHTGSSKTKNTTTLQKSHNGGQLKTTTTSTSSSVIDKENINATKCAKKHDTTNGLRITQMSQTNDNDMTTGTTKSTLYPRSDNNGSSDDNVVRSSSFDEQQQNLKNSSQPTTVDSSCNLNQEDQRVTRDLKREGCGAGDSNSDGQTSETRLVALETSADASISECNLPDSKKKANIDKFKSNYEQQDEQQQRQQQQQQRLEQEYFVQQNQPPIQYHYNQMPLSDCAIKEAYVHKMVKVNDDDRWSLISLGVQQSESSNSTAIESSVEINNTCQDNVSCQQQEKMQPQLVIQGCSLQRLQHNQQYHPSIAAFSYPQNNNQQRQTCNQQQNQSPNSIELKFVDRMRRKFEFSVDSFQIILDSLLEFYDYAPQASITSSYEYPQQELQRDSFSSAQSHAGTNSIISNDGVNSNCSSGCCCCEGGCIGRRTDEMIDSNDCTNRGAKGICHEVSDFMPSEDEQNLNSNQNSNHHKHDHHNDLPLDQQMSSTVSSSGCSSSSSVVSSSSSSLSYDDDHEDLYGDADISPSSSVSTSSLISSTNMSMLSSDSKRPRNERGRSGDGIDTGFVGCRNAAIKALPRTTRTSQAINKQGEAKNTLCMEQSRSSYNLKQRSKLHQVANNVSSGFSGDVQGDFPNLKHHNQTTNDMNQNDEFLNSHNCHRLSCGDDIMSRNGYCSHYAAMSNGSCSGSSRYGDASSLYGDIELSGASSCAVISENFYPTVIGRSEYGDFKEALYHLERKLIATRSPEEIRGGGLLKYCNLLVKSYKPTNAYQIRTLERYMCSRFFIDFSDLNQQQAKLESYLANHFSDDPRLKFDYLTILHSIVQRSTVCLMNHELRLTLNMIRDLACKLHEQQLQRRRLQQQQQQSQQQQQQKQPVPLLLGTMNMVLVSIRPHSGMRQPSSNPTA